jgi:hypothetical protein
LNINIIGTTRVGYNTRNQTGKTSNKGQDNIDWQIDPDKKDGIRVYVKPKRYVYKYINIYFLKIFI